MLVFDWDSRKELSNRQKHGLSFLEAASAFADPLAAIFADPDHSADEPREILIGHSRAKRLLLVCFTERGAGKIRIVSARQATRKERLDYENHFAH